MPYPKGKPKSEESKRKASEALKGRKRDPELMKRITEARIANGNHRPSEETKRKIGEANRRSQALKREQGLPLPQHSQKGKPKSYVNWEAEPEPVEIKPRDPSKGGRPKGYKHSEESKQKMREARRKAWADGVYDNKKPARRRRVSKTERLLTPVAEALGYQHNDSSTSGYFFIPLGAGRGMTPDFVDREGRRVLEYFGNFWHHPDDEPYYIEAYAEVGWECRVVWESDLPALVKEADISEAERGVINDHLSQLTLPQTRGNIDMVPRRSEALRGKEVRDATYPTSA